MKYKQFKKEINQDSDLLKLSGKDLAAIFEIDVLKAKYFKKRYKEELQYAVDFDINDTKWFDTLVNQSTTSKPKKWINSDTYNEDWFKAINYGTDNLKPNKLNGKDFDGDISNINNNFNLSSEELDKKHRDDIIKKCNSEEEANYYLNMYDYLSKEPCKIEVDFSDLKRVFNEIENKHFKRTKPESKVGDSKTTVNSKTVGLLDFKTSKNKLNNLSDNNLLQVGDSFKDINTGKKYTKSKYGTILETNCTCPVCNKKVLLETFNSGKNLVECPECNILLQIEDNVVERFTDELPKSNVTIESLMSEINKIVEDSVHKKVLSVIRAIRNSFVGSEIVYTKGSCYQFYLILREVFPQAEAFYDEDHLITKIENKYYDITGEVSKGRCLPFEPTPNDTWINEPYNIFKLK